MFEHLVESTSHKDDLSRKGSFILGTIVAYAIVLTGLGILSIYLYDAQLENQNLELTTLVAKVEAKGPPMFRQPLVPCWGLGFGAGFLPCGALPPPAPKRSL